MSLWQRLSLSPKQFFFIKLFCVSFCMHGVVLGLLMLHTFSSHVSITLHALSGTSVYYVPVVASDAHIKQMNASVVKSEGGSALLVKKDIAPAAQSPGSSKISTSVVEHKAIHKAIKMATGMSCEKIQKIKTKNKKKSAKEQRKKELSAKKQKEEQDKIKTKNKHNKTAQEKIKNKQNVSVKDTKKEEKAVVEENVKSVSTQQVGSVEKMQQGSELIDSQISGTPVYVSYKDFDAAVMGAAFIETMKEKWIAPVGMPRDIECEIVVSIDKSGKLVSMDVARSSNVLVYDMAVKESLVSMEFPKEVHGTTIRIVFKP